MANSNLLLYLVILSVASSISSISAQFHRRTVPKKFFYNAFGLDEDVNGNDYQFVPPETETFPQVSLDTKNSDLVETQERPEERMARYLGDNNIICEVSVTKGVFAEEGYEFYPSEYINKTCIYSNTDPFKIESNGIRKPEVCLHNDNDFGCQTLYEELNVLKKSIKGKRECWDHMTQLVAVGCKCNIRFQY